MTRAQRLLEILQILREHRFPVRGAVLAEQLDISLRTLYRDIATLQAQGADIQGEAGLGYVLRPGFNLPPLMLSSEELEALSLGIRWVAQHGDEGLAQAARKAAAKIGAVVPEALQRELAPFTLLVGPGKVLGNEWVPIVRQAIRREVKILLDYADAQGAASQRTIWPFALGFLGRTRIIAAWCELRQDYRHFRADRIQALSLSEEPYPRGRHQMLVEWKAQENIPADIF